MGLLALRAGRVLFNGEEITGLRRLGGARGLANVPQRRIVFPQVTVRENLEMGAYTERDRGRIAAALERVHALFPILAERHKQKAGRMSGASSRWWPSPALMTTPRLILRTRGQPGLDRRPERQPPR